MVCWTQTHGKDLSDINELKVKRPFTLFQKTVAGTVLLFIVLVLVNWRLAWIPPLLLLVVCMVAPFMYRRSFFLPVISRGNRRSKAVALTFDDGPDPLTTPLLLKLLQDHGIQATFFLTGRHARAYPELVRAIIQAGHTIGNHSYRHDNLIAFKGRRRVFRDIAITQRILARSGVVPAWFRPPVGVTYPALGPVLAGLNLQAVTFTRRAGDRGNRSIRHISRRILKKIRAGDIILLHDVQPAKNIPASQWLAQISMLLAGLNARRLSVRPLAELIEPPPDRIRSA